MPVFSRTDLFKTEVRILPSSVGEYLIIYDDIDASAFEYQFEPGEVIALFEDDVAAPGNIRYKYFDSSIRSTYGELLSNITPKNMSDPRAVFGISIGLDELVTTSLFDVSIDFSGPITLNNLSLRSVSKKPFLVKEIYAIRPNGTGTLVFSGLKSVVETTSINFNSIVTASSLVLILQQPSFETKSLITRNTKSVLDSVNVNPVASKVRSSSNETIDLNSKFVYSIGMSEVSAGTKTYDLNGVYVSKPITVSTPILIGLDVSEEYILGDCDTYTPASFEYTVTRLSFNDKGQLINRNSFPILPTGLLKIGANIYDAERILVSSSTMIGKTRFRAHTISGLDIESDLVIYRDGTQLEEGTDYTINNTSAENDSDPFTEIRFLSSTTSIDLYERSIYTASYTPIHLMGTPLKLSERSEYFRSQNLSLKNNDGWLRNNNYLELSDRIGNQDIKKSTLYLSVIMRLNSYKNDKTHRLNWFSLKVGRKTESRFITI